VTPANPSIIEGTTKQFTATGTFSDNSTQDLTSQVTWASAAPAFATITSAGLATAVAPGTSTINATFNGVAGSTLLAVIPIPLVTVTSIKFVRNKKHMVTQITVDFSGAVNAAEASNPSTYRLAMPGKKGSFDAKNAQVIKLKSAVLNGALGEVILTPKKPFALSKPVQLRVNGLPPAGLQDSMGRLIDGDHNGQPGGNAVAVLRAKGVTLSAVALTASRGTSTLQATAAAILMDQEVVIGVAHPAGAERLKPKIR
jgi:Bacterial Ig-like domain (group 2)